jgi:hypothetical protein
MGPSDNNHTDPRFRHLMDPENYRKDGRERKGFGKFLQKHGPAIGKTVLQVGRGVVDGIPGVSQVVNTLLPQKHVTPAQAGTRILVGWATVVMVAAAMLMKVTGQIDTWTMLQLILAFIGL